MSLSNLGQAERHTEAYSEAEAYLKESVAIYRQLYPQGNGDVGVALSSLARTYLKERKFPQASAAFRQAIPMKAAAFPADDPRILDDRIYLGMSLSGQKQYPEAEKLLEDADAAVNSRKPLEGTALRRAKEICSALTELYHATHQQKTSTSCTTAAR